MRMDLKEIRERTRMYFDTVGPRYFELFKDELSQKSYDRELLTRFAGLLGRGAQLCDAGCGPCGHVTRFLADQGLEVIGVDLSARCIDLVRAAQPDLAFQVMDMLRMDFETDRSSGYPSSRRRKILERFDFSSPWTPPAERQIYLDTLQENPCIDS